MLTLPNEPYLQTNKRSARNSKEKSSKKPNLDLSIQFQNGSFSIDTYEQDYSVHKLPCFVNQESSVKNTECLTENQNNSYTNTKPGELSMNQGIS